MRRDKSRDGAGMKSRGRASIETAVKPALPPTQPVGLITPYVARDGSSSALVIYRTNRKVRAIHMVSGELYVSAHAVNLFDKEYKIYDYDPKKAAQIYLNHYGGMTGAAREALLNIINPPQGAADMTAKKKVTHKEPKKKSVVEKPAAGKITPTPKPVPVVKVPAIKHAPAGAPVKPEKATKVAKVKKSGDAAAPSTRLRVNLDAKITAIQENPKRAGSGAHARYALYKAGMTVGEFLKAGGIPADVHWDLKQKFIKLENPK